MKQPTKEEMDRALEVLQALLPQETLEDAKRLQARAKEICPTDEVHLLQILANMAVSLSALARKNDITWPCVLWDSITMGPGKNGWKILTKEELLREATRRAQPTLVMGLCLKIGELVPLVITPDGKQRRVIIVDDEEGGPDGGKIEH